MAITQAQIASMPAEFQSYYANFPAETLAAMSYQAGISLPPSAFSSQNALKQNMNNDGTQSANATTSNNAILQGLLPTTNIVNALGMGNSGSTPQGQAVVNNIKNGTGSSGFLSWFTLANAGNFAVIGVGIALTIGALLISQKDTAIKLVSNFSE